MTFEECIAQASSGLGGNVGARVRESMNIEAALKLWATKKDVETKADWKAAWRVVEEEMQHDKKQAANKATEEEP